MHAKKFERSLARLLLSNDYAEWDSRTGWFPISFRNLAWVFSDCPKVEDNPDSSLRLRL